MYKFRSMIADAEKLSGPVWAQDNDDRITRVGRFIRKWRIDELPQLINVLKGDMSLIGPRPERPYFVEQFMHSVPRYMVKHQVRPGMSGWAQVNGWRGETPDLYKMEKRVEYDLWYIRNWSLWLDMKIIMLTAMRGFIGSNAY